MDLVQFSLRVWLWQPQKFCSWASNSGFAGQSWAKRWDSRRLDITVNTYNYEESRWGGVWWKQSFATTRFRCHCFGPKWRETGVDTLSGKDPRWFYQKKIQKLNRILFPIENAVKLKKNFNLVLRKAFRSKNGIDWGPKSIFWESVVETVLFNDKLGINSSCTPAISKKKKKKWCVFPNATCFAAQCFFAKSSLGKFKKGFWNFNKPFPYYDF